MIEVIDVAAFNDFNQKIMEEFHANAGKMSGRFADTDVLILTTTGRKSGQMRWNPLVYSTDGDRYIIVASKGGAPASPDWYHNLVANGSAVVSFRFGQQHRKDIPSGAARAASAEDGCSRNTRTHISAG